MRRALWLGAALLLFALGAWLMSRSEGNARVTRRAPSRHEFPRRAGREDLERIARRRTLAVPPADAGGMPAPARDPLLVALPPDPRRTLVFEASAIRDSPLGRLFIDCLPGRALERLDALKTDGGLDPMSKLDRLAVGGDVVAVTGDFAGARWQEVLKNHVARAYGGATLYEPGPEESRRRRVIATWGNGMLVMGRDAAQVTAAIDRLEGRAPAAAVFDESNAYGEIYGTVSGEEVSRLLPEETRARLRGAADRIELHVDTRDEHDVLVVADATGADSASVGDLGKSLGAALAIARVKAEHDGDGELAGLLEGARVSPESGTFRVEVALPLESIRRRLGRCREEREAERP